MGYNYNIPTRQVHLDFHTSPHIKGIGKNFSKENFQNALKKGNIESITVFAKCHHGLCYYPTKVGAMHPNLDFDFTGAMVDAAHEIGVRAPIYITAGWSDEDAKSHSEWLMRKKDGMVITTDGYDADAESDAPKKHVAWQMLCLNDGSYAAHIYALTEEICQRYKKIDGLFYDICFVGGGECYCDECIVGMKKLGLNSENEADAKQYYIIKHQAFMQKCIDILKKYHPNATVFFNSGGADIDKPDYHSYQSHFEMEDLPTAWGGYNKLPMRAKFFACKGKGCIAMTGKFHLDWGEFGGFKTKEALKAEIAAMALYGVGASVGDHMHPDGEMENETYDNIGYAYDYLDKISPYCYGGESCADIGVYLSGDFESGEGIANILTENQIDFEVVTNNNFERFDTVIFSAGSTLDDDGYAKLQQYINGGGKVLFMADALLKNGSFCIDAGVEYTGKGEFDCDYITLTNKKDGIPDAPMLCNISGHKAIVKDAEVYAEFITPYFSRTQKNFCGHKNTPHNKESQRHVAIAKKGNVVYTSHSLAKEYFTYGSVFHKRYFMLALGLIYNGGILKTKGLPSQARCRTIEQKDKSRYCVNMYYVSPVKRGKAEIIEDIVPLYNIEVTLRTDKEIEKVYLPLEDKELDFVWNGKEAMFTLPCLNCHQSIVLSYRQN